jgi:hypothetical protein
MTGTIRSSPIGPAFKRGTRDLPALQAGRSSQSFNELLGFPAFNLVFLFYGTGAVRVLLGIEQVPRTFGFGELGTPLVMPFDAIFKVLGGPDVIAPIF